MALVAKAVFANAPASVSGGRQATGARNIASVDRAQIEEISPKAGVSPDEAKFTFQDYGRSPDRRERLPAPRSTVFDTPSQAFATVFEMFREGDGGGTDGEATTASTFGALLARAVGTYENNVRIVEGTYNTRGASLNMNL